MSETTLRQYVKKSLDKNGFDVQGHEDKYSVGIPDLSYAKAGADGWIELKYMKNFPVKDSTPIRVGLRPNQRTWLKKRCAAGNGQCFVLTQVGRDYYIHSALFIDELYEGMSHERFIATREERWSGSIDFRRLTEILCYETNNTR